MELTKSHGTVHVVMNIGSEFLLELVDVVGGFEEGTVIFGGGIIVGRVRFLSLGWFRVAVLEFGLHAVASGNPMIWGEKQW